jgi:fibro-slime domain-containing protein
MQRLSEIIEHILRSGAGMRKRRNLILCLAAVVVFVTTYMLILPAITIDNSSAKKMPGINVTSSVKTEAVKDTGSDAGTDHKNNVSGTGTVNGSKAAASVKDSTSQSGDNGSSGQDEPRLGVSGNNDGDAADSSGSADTDDKSDKAGKSTEPDDKESTGKKSEDKQSGGSDSGSADDTLELLTEETTLTYVGKGYTVKAVCGVDTKLPADVKLNAKEIKKNSKEFVYDEYYDKALDEVRAEDGKDGKKRTREVRLFDISFTSKSYDADKAKGSDPTELEPAVPVKVEIIFDKPVEINKKGKVRAVHFTENAETKDGKYTVSDARDTTEVLKTKINLNDDGLKDDGLKDDELKNAEFESTSFSVYGIVYTVDFHWEVDGKKIDYSIPGGSAISLKTLLPIMKVCTKDEAEEFVAEGIEKVEFSDTSLLVPAKVEEDTTLKALKKSLKLKGIDMDEVGELDEEEVLQEADTIKAVDWVLISLQPFSTDETLTVTMKDGEVFRIKVTDSRDPLGLNDRTFALVSQNGSQARSIQASAGETFGNHYLNGSNVTCTTNGGVAYCDKSATAWLIEYDLEYVKEEESNDRYFISDGYNSQGGNYLNYNSTGGYWEMVSLTKEQQDNITDYVSPLKIERDDDGTIYISDGNGHYLVRDGYNNFGNGTKGDAAKLTLCLPESSGSTASHKATCISAQDLNPGQTVVIYQRVLYYNESNPNDENNNTYMYYAVADAVPNSQATNYGPAEAVRLWNSGDSVYWRGDPAIYWKFKEATDPETGEPTGYYFFENAATGRYLAAKADGTLIQNLNDYPNNDPRVNVKEDNVQIALPGIDSGSYTSKIANWDYANSVTSGLKVNDANHDAVPESISSETLANSQEFYFAVRDPIVQGQLTEVDTVDSAAKGIKITMYDFSGQQGGNWGARLDYMNSIIGTPEWEAGVYRPGIMKPVLENGWPTSKNTSQSLSKVFNPTGQNASYYQVNRKQENVNHLFINSVYESTGYYSYSGFENYAYLPEGSSDFKVYEQVGTPSSEDRYYMKRGNFMPFDELDVNNPAQNITSSAGSGSLGEDHPRYGEDLYYIKNKNNGDYFFGMVMEAKFQQGENGKNDRGDPMRYDFNGDDDLWVYVDDVLLLDIGGVHDAFKGYIDFTSGVIHVDKQNTSTNDNNTTIKQRFKDAGKFPDGTDWDDNRVDEYFTGNTFKDFSSHDFKMFYMERGAGASNLDMKFNLTVLPQNQFKVTKKMPETSTDHTVQDEYGNAAFYYQAYKADTNPGDLALIKKSDTVTIDGVTKTATYEDGKPLVWKQDSNGEYTIFEVRPGHSAIFPVKDRGVRYYVEEVNPSQDVNMLDNFDVLNNSPEANQPENKQVLTSTKSAQQRSEVIYTNKPDDSLVNELRITKNLHGKMLTDENGDPVLSAIGIPYFEYAVYLENNDGKMVPYALGEYYIIDKQGRFVTYNKGKRQYQDFEKTKDANGKTIYKYYEVTPANEDADNGQEKTRGNLAETTTNPKITDHFGNDGLVWDIRDGDTLVIPGLMEGTHFIVSERTYGDKPHVTTDPNKPDYKNGKWYLYDSANVEYVDAEGENISEDPNFSADTPENAGTIKSGLSKPANSEIAEGDIKMSKDAEVTVHNKSTSGILPIVVKKNWEGIDGDDPALTNTKVKVTLGRYVLKDKAGQLTIKKTGVPSAASFSAMYTVKDSNDHVVKEIPYSSSGVGSAEGVTIPVAPGTYTVTETINSQDEAYTWNHDPSNAPGGSATKTSQEIADDGHDTVTFSCAPVVKTGSLKITSSYSIPEGGNVDFSDVTYTVYTDAACTIPATKADGTAIAPISFAQASASGGFTIDGLKIGTYTVKENGVPTDSNDGNYTLQAGHVPEQTTIVTESSTHENPVVVPFSSTYVEKAQPATITYYIGKPSNWGGGGISGTNTDFAIGKTVKLSFSCENAYYDKIKNIPQDQGGGITYGGQTLNYTRIPNFDDNTSTYEIVFQVIDDANLSVIFNDVPANIIDLSFEEINSSRSTSVATPQSLRSALKTLPRLAVEESENNIGSGTRDATPIVDYGTPPNPSDTNKKYVDDASFTMDDPDNPGTSIPYTVELDQAGEWTWDSIAKNAELPVADEDGNLYYYYIKSVEEDGAPAGTTTTVKLDGENTFIVGKDKHMTVDNSTTPPTLTPEPLEVYNTVKGSLKVTKNVAVNKKLVTSESDTALINLADGTYTFTIAGKANTPTENEQSRKIEITITNGAASPVEVENLTPGAYIVTEVTPTNGTSLMGSNDIEVTVLPGKIGNEAPEVTFTNNIDTTQLTVNKVWTDSSDVNHSDDIITYVLYRIPYITGPDNERVEYDPEPVTQATGLTGRLTAATSPAWTETVTNLPKSGEHTLNDGTKIAVNYEYYVAENAFAGYKPSVSGGENNGNYSFTFSNEPHSSFDRQTEVNLEKKWQKSDGQQDTDAHNNDSITFSLVQKKYEAKVSGQDKKIYPVKINLINGDGSVSNLSKTVYLPQDCQMTFNTDSNSSNRVLVTGTNKDGTYLPRKEVYINNANGGREVTFALQNQDDMWDTETSGTKWTLSMHDNSNANENIIEFDNLLDRADTSGDGSLSTYEYTMMLNETKSGTIIEKYNEHALGECNGAESDKWKGMVSDLPYYEKGSDGKFYIYTYEVKEIKINSDNVGETTVPGSDGETPEYLVEWHQDTSTGEWIVTNKKKPAISISIHKVDENDFEAGTPHLGGAKFRLEKYKSLSPLEVDPGWTPVEAEESAQNPGIFRFDGLEAGYYKIVETQRPVGYISNSEDPVFLVRMNSETHEMEAVLVYSSGDNIGQPISGNATDTVRIENTTFTIGNTPGVALPFTGGSGTRLITIIGVMFTVFAVAGIVMKKRRSIVERDVE